MASTNYAYRGSKSNNFLMELTLSGVLPQEWLRAMCAQARTWRLL